MQSKVILVVLDGLNFQVAQACMGYMQGLVKAKKATLYRVQSEIPSLSRPLYECILTGKTPIESGIMHNDVVRLSQYPSIFSRAKEAGLTTAAAAYHWMSELYNRAPYKAARDRFTHNKKLNIQHGCFYHVDHYPDSHVFVDAEALRLRYRPDFLLVHSMNIDDAGHQEGLNSKAYRSSTRAADGLLARYIPTWLAQGYQVMVTSDHGMHIDCEHGGLSAQEREVPLFLLGGAWHMKSIASLATLKQVDICGLICHQLGVD
tara:strand:+ start:5852 stop:6634 length:783 start_codon:yes stop_codon:yes gene_type:complete